MCDKKAVLELRPNIFGKLTQYCIGGVLGMYIRYYKPSGRDPTLGHLPITGHGACFVTHIKKCAKKGCSRAETEFFLQIHIGLC